MFHQCKGKIHLDHKMQPHFLTKLGGACYSLKNTVIVFLPATQTLANTEISLCALGAKNTFKVPLF